MLVYGRINQTTVRIDARAKYARKDDGLLFEITLKYTGLDAFVKDDAELFNLRALDYRLRLMDPQDPELTTITQQMEHKFETEIKPLIHDFPKFKGKLIYVRPIVRLNSISFL